MPISQSNKLPQFPDNLCECFRLIQSSTGFGRIGIDVKPMKRGDTEIIMELVILYRYTGNDQACQEAMEKASEGLAKLQKNSTKVRVNP